MLNVNYKGHDDGSFFKSGQNYESSYFIDCDFQNTDFSQVQFEECIFEDCDLSNSVVNNMSLQSCELLKCKAIGIRWDSANQFLFEGRFIGSKLDNCVFTSMKLSGCVFESCSMRFVDLEACDLQGVNFQDCDLTDALFVNTNLKKSNFTTAFNFQIDPSRNIVDGMVLHESQLAGLLAEFKLSIIS